jgi:hypothetical protein
MANVKYYKNILGNPIIPTGVNAPTHAIPMRGARMVVARLRSTTLEAVAVTAPIFTLIGGPTTGFPAISTVTGQGYILEGTTPLALSQGVPCWSLQRITGGAANGMALPSYWDWCRVGFTLASQVNNGVLDIEVWYDNDADQMLKEQVGTSEYTIIP